MRLQLSLWGALLLLFLTPPSLAHKHHLGRNETKYKTHTCIFDEVYKHYRKHIVEAPQHYDRTRAGSGRSYIRLYIDTTYLWSDPLGLTCTSAGQTVTAQSSSSSGGSTVQYTCTSDDVLTSDKRNYLLSIIEQARVRWQQTLLVTPVSNSTGLVLKASSSPQGIYGGFMLNSTYTSTGVPYDTVIFATARPILSNGGSTETLAVATVVQTDPAGSGRPVLGDLNINLAGMSTDSSMTKQNYGVVTHEMTHALGFNYDSYSKLSTTATLYVGASNTPTQRTIITSPKVLAWARNYYNCPTMVGVELENQGGSGTELSHWEKRIANNEYMTGTASRNPVFSQLTLSLLEDTGWYGIDYTRSEQLLWGQGMGCDFVQKACPSWPQWQGYFCSNNGQTGCTSDFQAKGVCQISTASGVPATYQYFPGNPSEIGTYDLPDYCPLTWGYDNGWCFDTSQSSSGLENQGEYFGEDALCYQSTLLKDLPVGGSNNQVCYRSTCTGPMQLRVQIGSYWYNCPPAARISVLGYGGLVTCPTYPQQVCANSDTNNTWPTFSTISPNAGGPGLVVTISGSGFNGSALSVWVNDAGTQLTNVQILSNTELIATIPNSGTFDNPANIIERKVSIILTRNGGRQSSVGYNAFTIKVDLNVQFIKNALAYLGNNWLITAALVVAIVVTCAVCCYCCYRQKGDATEADEEAYYEE